MSGEIVHGGEDFVFFFAEAKHQAGLGGNVGVRFLCAIKKFQGTFIDGTFADLAIEARNGFGVVVENVWLDGEDDVESVPIAAKIRD